MSALSGGEIAVIVDALVTKGKRDAEGAAKLLNEIGRRLRSGEKVEGTHLTEYLAWALKRFAVHGDANTAFGLDAKPPGRQRTLNATP